MKKSIIFERPSTDDERVFVRLDMGAYYKEFLNSIPDTPDDREESFKHGVHCIVWGAFYLEAVINDTSRKILEDGTHGMIKSAEVLWPFVEKAQTQVKLKFILDALMPEVKQKKRFTTQVESIFKLRNRLAHYKESPKEVDPWGIVTEQDGSNMEKIRAKIDAAAKVTPDIVDAVLILSVCKRRSIILEVGTWIEQAIFEYYKPHRA